MKSVLKYLWVLATLVTLTPPCLGQTPTTEIDEAFEQARAAEIKGDDRQALQAWRHILKHLIATYRLRHPRLVERLQVPDGLPRFFLLPLPIDDSTARWAHIADQVEQLAVISRDAKDWAMAKRFDERALAIREKQIGKDAPGVVTSLEWLAHDVSQLGNYKEARALLERAVAIAQRTSGAESVEVASSTERLAFALAPLSDHDTARTLFERALAIREKKQGSTHRDTGYTLWQLGIVLTQIKLPEYAQARKVLERALTIREQLDGSDDGIVGMILVDLGLALHDMKANEEAREAFSRAAAVLEKAYGPDHRSLGDALANLAGTQGILADYSGAIVSLRKALPIRESTYGGDDPRIAADLELLGDALFATGDLHAAKLSYGKALLVREKASSPASQAYPLGQLRALHYVLREYDRAKAFCERRISVLEKITRPHALDVADEVGWLGWIYAKLGDLSAARSAFERSVALSENYSGPGDEGIARALTRLAGFLERNKDYDKAGPLYERALAIREKALGPVHPMTGDSLTALAEFREGRDDIAGARKYYERVLAIREAEIATAPAEAVIALKAVVRTRSRLGDLAGVREIIEPVLEKSAGTLEAWDPKKGAFPLYWGFIEIWQELGDHTSAVRWGQRLLDLYSSRFKNSWVEAVTRFYLGGALVCDRNLVAASIQLAKAGDIIENSGGGSVEMQYPELQGLWKLIENALPLTKGYVLLQQKRYTEAQKVLERAVGFYEQRTGNERSLVESLEALAYTLDASKKNVDAQHLRDRARDLRGKWNLSSGEPSSGSCAPQVPIKIALANPAPRDGWVSMPSNPVTIEGSISPHEQVLGVMVNETQMWLGSDGKFSGKTNVAADVDSLRVSVVFSYGRFVTESFKVERAPVGRSTAPGRLFAIVIGNQDYRDGSPWPQLKTPAADAKAVAHILKERFGFLTQLSRGSGDALSLVLLNASRADMFRVFAEIKGELTSEDTLLIYYAGHGKLDRELEKAFWIPIDADQYRDKWISASEVTDHLKTLKARSVLVISDSCYSGAMFRDESQVALGTTANRKAMLAQLKARRSRVLISSGSTEPVADGKGDGHSVFARAFITALREIPLGGEPAQEIFAKRIRELVIGRSEQAPQYQILQNSGHEGGDFVFLPIK